MWCRYATKVFFIFIKQVFLVKCKRNKRIFLRSKKERRLCTEASLMSIFSQAPSVVECPTGPQLLCPFSEVSFPAIYCLDMLCLYSKYFTGYIFLLLIFYIFFCSVFGLSQGDHFLYPAQDEPWLSELGRGFSRAEQTAGLVKYMEAAWGVDETLEPLLCSDCLGWGH